MLLGLAPNGGGAVDPLTILLVALALDAVFGDPDWLTRALPHPVVLIGKVIEVGERALNDPARRPASLILRGLALTSGVVLLAIIVGSILAWLSARLPGAWLLEACLVALLLAGRGLYDAVRAVAGGLQDGLEAGRAAVSHLVGRDPSSLDQAGIARAALESLAENFSDGVVAPVFWYLLFGLPGLAAYKAINTLDSMIGHRTPRFVAFGKVAARLDDAANWLPARLAGGLIVLAAVLPPWADARAAWRCMLRDAPRHRSVNAGWQEAALAGALGFALAGPRQYRNERVEDAWMGDGRKDLGPADIRQGLRLILWACGIGALLLVLAWLL